MEILWCMTPYHKHCLPSGPVCVKEADHVSPSQISPESTTWEFLSISGCFAVLHQLCSIRRSLPDSVFQSLAVALVTSCLDYGNAALGGFLCSSIVDYSLYSMLQTEIPVISPRAHHTATLGSTLAVLTEVHRLQAGSASFFMPTWSCFMLSL